MEYLFLMLAGIVYFAYAYLSFSDAFDKNSMMYFITIMTVVSSIVLIGICPHDYLITKMTFSYLL